MENQTQLENILSFFRNYNVISENVKYESGYPNIKPNVLVKFVAQPDGVDVLNGSNGQKILFLKKQEINSINIVDDSNPKRLVFSIYQDSENYNINFVSSGKNAGQTFVDIKHNILQLWKIAEERDITEEIKNYNEKANKENSKNFGIGCLIIFIALLAFVIYYFSTNKSTDDNPVNDEIATHALDSAVAAIDGTVDSKPVKISIDSAKIKDLKKYFTEKKDEFESYTWVKPKSRPVYINQNGFYCYFQKNNDGTVSNLRFVGQYAAEDWLFIRNIKFNIDGQTFNYVPNEMKTDHDSSIWEWFDDSVGYNNSNIIDAISKAKSVKIRFNGDQYYKDKIMSSDNIQSIKRTSEYYKALGGRY